MKQTQIRLSHRTGCNVQTENAFITLLMSLFSFLVTVWSLIIVSFAYVPFSLSLRRGIRLLPFAFSTKCRDKVCHCKSSGRVPYFFSPSNPSSQCVPFCLWLRGESVLCFLTNYYSPGYFASILSMNTEGDGSRSYTCKNTPRKSR